MLDLGLGIKGLRVRGVGAGVCFQDFTDLHL